MQLGINTTTGVTIRNRSQHQQGLTLIELMLTLFIASIVLSFGGTQFSQFMANNRMAAAANQVNIALHTARTEAIKRNSTIAICASKSWNDDAPECDDGATFSDGAIMFIDSPAGTNPDLQPAGAADILKAFAPIDGGITLKVADSNETHEGAQFVAFGPTGFPVTRIAGVNGSFHFQLCDKRGNMDTGAGIAAGRWISITPTGRPQMHRKQSAVQFAGNPNGGCGSAEI